MGCTTVTVLSPIPTITGLNVVRRPDQPVADVYWTQSVAGKVKITVDGSFSSELAYNAGNNAAVITGLFVAKTYEVCVTGV